MWGEKDEYDITYYSYSLVIIVMVEAQHTSPEIYLELIRRELTPENLLRYLENYDEATNTFYYPSLSSETTITIETAEGSQPSSYQLDYMLTHGQEPRVAIDFLQDQSGITELTVTLKRPDSPDDQGGVTITVIGVVEHTANTPSPLLDQYIIDVNPKREGLNNETNLAIYNSLLVLSRILQERPNLNSA